MTPINKCAIIKVKRRFFYEKNNRIFSISYWYFRFIHYDSKQSRSITVREAARLQSFDDDFDFVGSQGNAYQMIGNAVPPLLAKNIALALSELLDEMNKE